MVKYFNYDDEIKTKSGKIPYDTEPISRNRNYSRPSVSSSGFTSNKVVVFLLVLIIVFNVVIGFVVFNQNISSAPSTTVENNITISGESSNTTYAVAKAMPSVVCIASGYNSQATSGNITYENFQSMNDRGSGVILDIDKTAGDATIVTCQHVVSGNNDSIYILLFDSYKPIKATYIGGNVSKDIATLKITDSNEIKRSSALAAKVGDSSLVAQGNKVVAIGNPMSSGFDACDGSVRKAQTLTTVSKIGVERVIATSVPINSGNSGGGLFNDKGELVGIVNAKIENASIDAVSYAIPSNYAVSIARSIERNNGTARKAVLGLDFVTSDAGRDVEILDGNIIFYDTVLVNNIVAGSAAEIAGIENGDVVLGFTYHDSVFVPVMNIYSFEDHAYNIGLGDTIEFLLKRGNNNITKTVVITSVSA